MPAPPATESLISAKGRVAAGAIISTVPMTASPPATSGQNVMRAGGPSSTGLGVLTFSKKLFNDSMWSWSSFKSKEPKNSPARVAKQVMVKINLYRTRRGTRTAKRACVGKMLEFLKSRIMRRDDRADRALISCTIRMSADVSEDRADIEARAAADALQHFLVARAEHAAAPAVVEDDVQFARAVGVAIARRAGDRRRIDRERLPG